MDSVMKKIFLLIDADAMVYASSVVSKEESDDGFQHDLEEGKLKFDNILHHLTSHFEDMGIDFEYILFLEGEGNIRKSLVDTYKLNRKDKPEPPLRREIARYATEHYNSFISTNVESDDTLSATWYKYHRKYDLIICSMDKDLKQLPCTFYDTYYGRDDSERICKISPQEGERNFWRQMLIGDVADGVDGIKGMGKARTNKLIPDSLSSPSAMASRVYRKYIEQYGISKGRVEFFKAYHLMRLPKTGVAIPKLEEYLMFS